jgi:hypothetical protein
MKTREQSLICHEFVEYAKCASMLIDDRILKDLSKLDFIINNNVKYKKKYLKNLFDCLVDILSIDKSRELSRNTKLFIKNIAKFISLSERYYEIFEIIERSIERKVKKEIKSRDIVKVIARFPYSVEICSKSKKLENEYKILIKNIGLTPIFNIIGVYKIACGKDGFLDQVLHFDDKFPSVFPRHLSDID